MMSSKIISDTNNFKTDIVVIGAGGTGFAAAATAAEKGARVILLEKESAPGGTTLLANGLMAAESPVQKRTNIIVLKDEVFKIAMDYSHWTINPKIIRAFIDKSGDTIQWLENRGLKFASAFNKSWNKGGLWVCHNLEGSKRAGTPIIKQLREYCQALGVQLILNCAAKKIFTGERNEVTGVLATMLDKTVSIIAKSVIISTGGYTGNKELLKQYYPAYNENIKFLGRPHMGDGLLMAMEIGSATDGLGVLLMHPHYYKGSVRIDALAQEPSTIWVNKKGERFTDETITFRTIECGNTINRQLDKCNYVLFGEEIKNRIEKEGFIIGCMHGVHENTGVAIPDLYDVLKVEAEKGEVKISDTWDEVAKWMGVAPDTLKDTIIEYNNFCEQGYDPIFQKERRYLQAVHTPPYYAIRCFVSCLDTIGGIKINQNMEVLNNHDDSIPGLYAGGDAAGGWQSDTYCILLPGTALGFAINSGRIAGENASKFILRK
jgi:fumarate reductase flavoprotein subunit